MCVSEKEKQEYGVCMMTFVRGTPHEQFGEVAINKLAPFIFVSNC